MGLDQTRAQVAAPGHPAQAPAIQPFAATAGARGAEPGWESRLYGGLRVERVPAELRTSLAESLGEAGVEAEHLLALVTGFLSSRSASRSLGDLFLRRLAGCAGRLTRAADRLEVATQGYLAALEAAYPGLRAAAAQDDVWWREQGAPALGAEPLEMRLRRCGFAYRHVVATHLAANLEAVTDYTALLLHALRTLPPAGILPAGSLYRGLDELTAALQGYVIPNHVADLNEHTPGLLTGVARLYALDAYEETSVESDITWARAQAAFAQQVRAGSGARGFGGGESSASWATDAVREWNDTIAALESLRRTPERRVTR